MPFDVRVSPGSFMPQASAWRCSPLHLTWLDAIAIYPRWAADAVATKWLERFQENACEPSRAAKMVGTEKHEPGMQFDGVERSALAPLGLRGVEVVDFFCAAPSARNQSFVRPPPEIGNDHQVAFFEYLHVEQPWERCAERVAIRAYGVPKLRQHGERTRECRRWI